MYHTYQYNIIPYRYQYTEFDTQPYLKQRQFGMVSVWYSLASLRLAADNIVQETLVHI